MLPWTTLEKKFPLRTNSAVIKLQRTVSCFWARNMPENLIKKKKTLAHTTEAYSCQRFRISRMNCCFGLKDLQSSHLKLEFGLLIMQFFPHFLSGTRCKKNNNNYYFPGRFTCGFYPPFELHGKFFRKYNHNNTFTEKAVSFITSSAPTCSNVRRSNWSYH